MPILMVQDDVKALAQLLQLRLKHCDRLCVSPDRARSCHA